MHRATFAFAVFILTSITFAAPDGASLVDVKLISETAEIHAGKPFRVGVVMKIEPEYHVYWINPGESGQPPEVKWVLPAGYTAGDIQWPVPKRFILPGFVMNYGYDKEVTLTATITPSANASVTNPEILADVSWLVCNEDRCLPASKRIELKLPDSQTAAENKAKIEKSVQSVPVTPDVSPAVIRTIENKEGDSRGLKVEWKSAVSKTEFYPLPMDGVKISGTSLSTNKMSTPPVSSVEITASHMAGTAEGDLTVRGVLAFEDETGERRAIEVSVPAIKGS